MNDPKPEAQLLTEVLGEGVSADFRQGLLSETLHLARRRRQTRQVRNVASVLAVLAGLALLVWHQIPSRQVPSTSRQKPYALVHTQPLKLAACVQTRPFPASRTVTSARLDNIIVTTRAGSRVRELNDEELLALAPEPAALVRYGPHWAELVLVNTADQQELMRN
jgi:hypothetical protein